MNKIVLNLTQIADAAEYLDKKTSAAWKIRSCLTNMVVWAGNSYLYAVKSNSPERLAKSMVEVATLRTWMRDANESSFVLDLTPAAIKKTLGLERVVDVHEEACRSARQKCIQTRSALHFQKYYKAALAAFDEQKKSREEAVEKIAALVSDHDFKVSHEVADHLTTFMNIQVTPGEAVPDRDLYDDASVERQADQLAEVVGNALESMYDVCDGELAAAITADKVNRLSGYHAAIMNMMQIAGVDTVRLAQRRVKLEALIDSQIAAVSGKVVDIEADIAKQIDEMNAAKVEEGTNEPGTGRAAKEAYIAQVEAATKPKMQRVKKGKVAHSLAEIKTVL